MSNQQVDLFRRSVAEAIGTFALVFAGCGAIMSTAKGGTPGHVGVALTFGTVVAVMIFALGHISKAHFNPAVTLAFAITRHLPLREMFAYWAAQVAGAFAAAALLKATVGDFANLGTTVPSVTTGSTFVLELVMTAFLMFVIMAVATDTRAVGQSAALAIGGTVALDALFGGPLTGASMNPARSLGPAVVSGELSHLWLYLLAPAVGATVGALAYQFVRGREAQSSATR